MSRAPAIFVSHGAPTIAIEDDAFTQALAAFGAGLVRPRAVVVVSAHWEARGPIRIGSGARPELIYDFAGFPDALYQLTYPAPGTPELAEAIRERLKAAGIPAQLDPDRGWDHGVWVPLRLMLPAADVPVVEVSQPLPRTASEMIALGRALGGLRDEGVAILGSGGVVHNLATLAWGHKDAPAAAWAGAFDDWVWSELEGREESALAGYRGAAPYAERAVPTSEHFDPLLVTLGARQPGDRLRLVHAGFQYATLSMRSFAFA